MSEFDAASGRQRLVEIRCSFAEMASREADAAEARAVRASRTYKTQLAALKSAQAANPGAARRLKEDAHRGFRRALFAAKTHEEVEAAASLWLADINRINTASRAAMNRLHREREAVEALAAELDRLTSVAEATRAMADTAAEACRAAREGLAAAPDLEAEATAVSAAQTVMSELIAAQTTVHAAAASAAVEDEASGGSRKRTLTPVAVSRLVPGVGVVSGGLTVAAAETAAASATASAAAAVTATAAAAPTPAATPPAAPAARPAATPPAFPASTHVPTPPPTRAAAKQEPESPPAEQVDYWASRPPAITCLLQGDEAVMSWLVQRLAGSDAEQGRRWRQCLSRFVQAVADVAVDKGYFVFPRDHPFWGQFTPEQARELARGLSALGFRYGGRQGFADDRAPGPRDLTLAAGSAGLTTVRVRYWPSVEEAALLYREAGVDAVAVVAEHAPAATMGQLMQLLGRRAETVMDMWNDWPRVQPLLLALPRG